MTLNRNDAGGDSLGDVVTPRRDPGENNFFQVRIGFDNFVRQTM